MVDGVVSGGQGTVTAGVSDLQLETEKDLFRRFHREKYVFAVLDVATAGIRVHACLKTERRSNARLAKEDEAW